jgi:hypothetical protein
MITEQGEFDFSADHPEDGYKNWLEEQKKYQRRLELRWGIILNKKVCVFLQEYDQPFEGIISIINHPPHSNKPPQLRIGHHIFQADEIKSITTLTE